MTVPVSYYTPGELTSPKWAFAFARGCNGPITEDKELFDGPVALFGSPPQWTVLRQAQAEGRDFYFGDHGYFGRKRFYRVTKNGYQHDGAGDYPPDRFLGFRREVKPWNRDGRHVLVCPNSDEYMALHGHDGQAWLRDVLTTIRSHTDREVIVRWKRPPVPQPEIRHHLHHAHAVVVFSSAAALDALISGVPVFVLAPFAAGARLGLSDLSQIESPIYPDDREPLLWALAYQQWTLPEMMQGHAWRALQEGESRAAA